MRHRILRIPWIESALLLLCLSLSGWAQDNSEATNRPPGNLSGRRIRAEGSQGRLNSISSRSSAQAQLNLSSTASDQSNAAVLQNTTNGWSLNAQQQALSQSGAVLNASSFTGSANSHSAGLNLQSTNTAAGSAVSTRQARSHFSSDLSTPASQLPTWYAQSYLEPANPPGGYPSWWFTRGVIIPFDAATDDPSWPEDYPVSDDYAVINQGVLKNLATAAAAELDADLASTVGGAGDTLHSLIADWATSTNADDYAVVNQGQLKALAGAFYDVLGSASYTAGMGLQPTNWVSGPYPWSASTNTADDYAVANIGQAENLFSFDLTSTNGANDTNNDGIPDWWENYYGVTNASALALRGDGLSNLQAFQNGLNPNDYYNGQPPFLAFAGGDRQRGDAGTLLPVPLSVLVNGGQSNAPVTLTVKSGHALLSANGSSPAQSVQVRSTNQISTYQLVAQANIILPNIVGEVSVIEATPSGLNSGTPATPIDTTASVNNTNLQPPTNFSAAVSSPTTALLSWTPSDTNQPTGIEISTDGGTNWSFLESVDVGISSTTVNNLTPDQTVLFRVYTGDNN